jgi:ribosomal protein S18 acetylase RimI-like enzyme
MRSAELTVRPYVAGDLEDCLYVFASNVPEFFRAHERSEFEAFLSTLPGPYFVVRDDDGATVACGGYAVENDTADLCWGMVRRENHGAGLGRRLTELRLAELHRDERVRRVRLHTSQYTVGFYERLGFRVTHVVAHGYDPGLHRHDMVLELGGP